MIVGGLDDDGVTAVSCRPFCRRRAQVVMSQGGSIDYFRTAVFNYPTLAEAYNVACRDGLRKVGIS